MKIRLVWFLSSLLVVSASINAQAVDSRTTPPDGEPKNILRPTAVFDPKEAKAALEPGSGSIEGTACSIHYISGEGAALAKGNHLTVYLYPATPYLTEWVHLSWKANPKHDKMEPPPPALHKIRLEGTTDQKGDFMFRQLKPGTYYLTSEAVTTIAGQKDVYVGSEESNQGLNITDYYETVHNTASFNDYMEKFVEIKNDGDRVKISLSPRSRGIFHDANSGHARCRFW